MIKKIPDYFPHPASYRDPSGFVFRSNGLYYRQVNRSYADNYEFLMSSGLYTALTKKGLLVTHSEVSEDLTGHPDRYKILLPQQIAPISYPGEWSPCQLKDAALLTLQVLYISLNHGMILKDATPLNVQFREGKAVFIDTLSFEKYDATLPWVAYRQFCECFLNPLFIHHYLQNGIHKIFAAYPEGIPAAMTARILPRKSRFRLGVWLHVLLPGKVRHDRAPGRMPAFSRQKMLHLAANLEDNIRKLNVSEVSPSTWSTYYRETIISSAYLEAKERCFRDLISDIDFSVALDLGANDGYFSKILAEKEGQVIAVDAEWQCINNLYQFTRQHTTMDILPLCVDIANPTPSQGFHHAERLSFTERMPADLVVVLALIHHLALGRNIPLPQIASYLSALTQECLILEFVPLSDPKAAELIRNKTGPTITYDVDTLEQAFLPYFQIEQQLPIPGTDRVLYRLKKNMEVL